jgi:hypothetical protein
MNEAAAPVPNHVNPVNPVNFAFYVCSAVKPPCLIRM